MEAIWRDVRLAIRSLWKTKGFTFVAVLTLALGIGANTAIFTLIHAVMLKPLAVANPGELYRLGDTNNCCVNSGLQDSFSLFPYPFYVAMRDQTPEFVELAAFQANVSSLSVLRAGTSRVAEAFRSEFVSGNYFAMFGVHPTAGRTLGPDDDRQGSPVVAVLNFRAWRDRFGLDPAVIGSRITANGTPATIIGVAPADFFGDTLRADPPDFWIPLGSEPALRGSSSLLASTGQSWLYSIGRLQPAANPQQVQARITSLLQQYLSGISALSEDNRARIPKQHITLSPGASGVTTLSNRYGDGLRLLAIVSALVLLITCANIANLLLARTNQFQLAVRTALGASRSRIVRQTLTEGVTLAVIGGAAGIAVAYAGTHAILLLAFRGATFVPIAASPSIPVLGFALLLSIVTGVLFSVLPAAFLSRTNPIDSLRGGSRFTADRSAVPRNSLVVLQTAVSLVLLVGAGLLTESLWRLEHQSFGFETNGRLVVKVNPALSGYSTEKLDNLYRQLRQRLAQIPGVADASFSLYGPMGGNNWSSGISIEGRPVDTQRPETASWDRIAPRFFETIGTRLVRGRTIDERDTPHSRFVTVVNEAFVRRFFPSGDPIGKHLGIGGEAHMGDFEIVGIVADAKYVQADEAAWPTFFVPLLQVPNYDDESSRSAQTRSNYIADIELRLGGRSENVEGAVRQALAEVDANLTVLDVLSLDEQLGRNFNQQRLVARLTSLYGLVALALASVGLYGVASYSVARRTPEIGIRMALGASHTRIAGAVLRSALVQIALGLLIGLPISLAAGRALASQLFGVGGSDPAILGGAAAALIVSAILSALIPALRAASVDPMRALRSE